MELSLVNLLVVFTHTVVSEWCAPSSVSFGYRMCKLLVIPVSYTHLDVYKRQQLKKIADYQSLPIPNFQRQKINEHIVGIGIPFCVTRVHFIFFLFVVFITLRAVSYTHLDVYKRQVRMRVI